MAHDFSSPEKKLENELEDIRQDIDRKVKEQRTLEAEMDEFARKKEILEDELEDMRKEEERLRREQQRLELFGDDK